ncbi:MAG TPA: hypothetical protein VG407_05730 [Caulobacteraceae bacterium]|jgi:hypothetical protein|nr:hypothetical protein [Caulobacteraceae bacterium]
MRKGLFGAAMAAVLLAGPALAQPAPGSVCDFVQGAVIDSADHFEHLKGGPASDPGMFNVKPGFEPKGATCTIDPATTGRMAVICNWIQADEAAAHTLLTSLTREVATCLGGARKPRYAANGVNVIFANGPKYDIAEVGLTKDSLGDWVVFLFILEDHEMLH